MHINQNQSGTILCQYVNPMQLRQREAEREALFILLVITGITKGVCGCDRPAGRKIIGKQRTVARHILRNP